MKVGIQTGLTGVDRISEQCREVGANEEMRRDASRETIVETEAQEIIDITMKLGFDMVGVRRNIAPDFERPRPISRYKWETSSTIHEYLPESNITRWMHTMSILSAEGKTIPERLGCSDNYGHPSSAHS